MTGIEKTEEQQNSAKVKTLAELQQAADEEADLLERRLARIEEALGLRPIS